MRSWGGAPLQTSVLIRRGRDQTTPPTTKCEATTRRLQTSKGGGGSPGPDHAPTLTLDLQPPELRGVNLLVKPPGLWQPQQTRAVAGLGSHPAQRLSPAWCGPRNTTSLRLELRPESLPSWVSQTRRRAERSWARVLTSLGCRCFSCERGTQLHRLPWFLRASNGEIVRTLRGSPGAGMTNSTHRWLMAAGT